jgi:hypothetical protein
MQKRQGWVMPPEDKPFAIPNNKAEIVGIGVADAHVPCTLFILEAGGVS